MIDKLTKPVTMQNHVKKTVFMPIHPSQPRTALKPLKSTKRHGDIPCLPLKSIQAPPAILTKINGVSFHPTKFFTPPDTTNSDEWKVDWINKFDQVRNEHKSELSELKSQYEKLQSEYKQLKTKFEDKNKKRELVTIGTQTKFKRKSKLTQTDTPATTTSISIQTEATTTPTPISTHTEFIPTNISIATQTEFNAPSTSNPTHDKFTAKNTSKTPITYECEKCQKRFNKKSSLNDHQSETACADKKLLEWQCKICDKMFTYRGLRVHYGQFIGKTHSHRGKHGDKSEAYHVQLLEEHKKLKH